MLPFAAKSKLLRARGRNKRCGLGGRPKGVLCLERKAPGKAGGQGRGVACPREAAGASLPRGCPAGSTRIAPTPVGGAKGGPNTTTARGRGLLLPPSPRLRGLLLLRLLLLLGLLLLLLSPPLAATRPAGAPLLVLKTLEGELLERRAALVELLPTALASQIAGAGPKEHVVLLLLSRGKGAPGE